MNTSHHTLKIQIQQAKNQNPVIEDIQRKTSSKKIRNEFLLKLKSAY